MVDVRFDGGWRCDPFEPHSPLDLLLFTRHAGILWGAAVLFALGGYVTTSFHQTAWSDMLAIFAMLLVSALVIRALYCVGNVVGAIFLILIIAVLTLALVYLVIILLISSHTLAICALMVYAVHACAALIAPTIPGHELFPIVVLTVLVIYILGTKVFPKPFRKVKGLYQDAWVFVISSTFLYWAALLMWAAAAIPQHERAEQGSTAIAQDIFTSDRAYIPILLAIPVLALVTYRFRSRSKRAKLEKEREKEAGCRDDTMHTGDGASTMGQPQETIASTGAVTASTDLGHSPATGVTPYLRTAATASTDSIPEMVATNR